MAESLKLVHKPIFEGIPKCIGDLFTFSLHRSEVARYTRKPMMKLRPTDQNMSNSLFYRTIFIYNKLDDNIRTANPKMFAKKLYDYLKSNFAPFDIPKIDNG